MSQETSQRETQQGLLQREAVISFSLWRRMGRCCHESKRQKERMTVRERGGRGVVVYLSFCFC